MQIVPSIVANNDPTSSPRMAPPAFSSAPIVSATTAVPTDKDGQAAPPTDANSLLGSRGQGIVASGSAVPEIEVASTTGSGLPTTGHSTSPQFQQKSSTLTPVRSSVLQIFLDPVDLICLEV